MAGVIPQAVLGEQLGDVIGGRRVKTAVFTTFSFNPGFFELDVLPNLFDQTFHQVETARRLQLDAALREVREVAVYYDRSALSQDAMPAQLDFDRIDVSRAEQGGGVFHPKLVLLLVAQPFKDENGEESDGEYETLIVGTLSANLTRSGWWENLEAGHFEEVMDKDLADEGCTFRKDLLDAIRQVRASAAKDEDHRALDRIHDFVRNRVSPPQTDRRWRNKQFLTRLFVGQQPLHEWMAQHRIGTGWNLEVISPYFDHQCSTLLDRLYDVLQPKATRIYLPKSPTGEAAVDQSIYQAVVDEAEYGIQWANLPGPIIAPSNAKAKDARPRRVHAKVYRLWNNEGRQVVLVGSVNFTHAAHSHARAGNLEAAFLMDLSSEGVSQRWWLQPIDKSPSSFAESNPTEDDGFERACFNLSIRYDWANHQLDARLLDKTSGAIRLETTGGEFLTEIPSSPLGEWVALPGDAADRVRDLLRSTSFLRIVHGKGSWQVLMREVGMSHRPSLLSDLTAEEILMYWSLLSPEQREQFLIDKLMREGELHLEGIATTRSNRYLMQDTLFDRFAGVYHAFERLKKHVLKCIDEEAYTEAEAKLFGEKFDSLPPMLRKTLEQNPDPVMKYIIVLCAQQLADTMKAYDPDFWERSGSARDELEQLLAKLSETEDVLLAGDGQRQEFLSWYREVFLNEVEGAVEA
jgi:hypothetical protein